MPFSLKLPTKYLMLEHLAQICGLLNLGPLERIPAKSQLKTASPSHSARGTRKRKPRPKGNIRNQKPWWPRSTKSLLRKALGKPRPQRRRRRRLWWLGSDLPALLPREDSQVLAKMLVWSRRGHQRRWRRGTKVLIRRQLQRVLSEIKIWVSRG